MTALTTTTSFPKVQDSPKVGEIGMGGGLEPPSALAPAAALVNNYANGIAMTGLLVRNCITIFKTPTEDS